VCSFCAGKGHSQRDCQSKLNGLRPKCSQCAGDHRANSAACPKRQEKRRQIACDPRFAGSLLAKKVQEELKGQTNPRAFARPALNYPLPPASRTTATLVPAPLPSRPAWVSPPVSPNATATAAPAPRPPVLLCTAPGHQAAPASARQAAPASALQAAHATARQAAPASARQAAPASATQAAPVPDALAARSPPASAPAAGPATGLASHPGADAIINLLIQQLQSIIAALQAIGFPLSLPASFPSFLPSPLINVSL
jgi:hypothetical protein